MAKRKYVKENNLVKAINTDNLELQKPLVNEYYDISVHNSNMDKIDKGYKQNKNDISDIKNELSITENTSYTTANGIKEFECKDGYVDNVVIEGQTKILNAENQECEAGANGSKLVSVGQGDKIEVLTQSKNIFDGLFEYGSIKTADGSLEARTDCIRSVNYIPIATKNLFSWNDKGYSFVTFYYDENRNFISQGGNTPPNNAKYLKFRSSYSSSQNDLSVKWVISYEEVNSYIPPQYDKKQILTTLRSLPNGVKDTIEKQGNKYVKVQRCGEIVLNGGENWLDSGSVVENNRHFALDNILTNTIEAKNSIYCDKFETVTVFTKTKECIHMYTNSFNLSINTSKANSVSELKTWLKSNPVTVVYELATPIITELPNFNPQTFEGKTTLLINSGVIQTEADFEVTNSLGSELDVLKGKSTNIEESLLNNIYGYQKYVMIRDNGLPISYGTEDLNLLKSTGIYLGWGNKNSPITCSAIIEVIMYSATYGIQRYTPVNIDTCMYIRTLKGDEWTSWVKITTGSTYSLLEQQISELEIQLLESEV